MFKTKCLNVFVIFLVNNAVLAQGEDGWCICGLETCDCKRSHIECQCPPGESLDFEQNHIPKEMKTIKISQCQTFTLKPSLLLNSNITDITLTSIQQLNLDSGVFSNRRQKNVTLTTIKHLTIDDNSLENSLINILTLNQVNVEKLGTGAFNDSTINKVIIQHTQFKIIKEGAFRIKTNEFHIINSNIETIAHRGIELTGADNVTLERSRIGTIHSSGFMAPTHGDTNVRDSFYHNFLVTNNYIDTIKSAAFDFGEKDWVNYGRFAKFLFTGNNVDILEANAFEYVRKPYVGHVEIKENKFRKIAMDDPGMQEATTISGNELECTIHLCNQVIKTNTKDLGWNATADDSSNIKLNFYDGFICKANNILPTVNVSELYGEFEISNECVEAFVQWEVQTAIKDLVQKQNSSCAVNDSPAAAGLSKPRCGGILTESDGIITSENYPNYYAPGLLCDWQLSAPVGKNLKVTFTHISTEYQETCGYDYVEVRDGNSVASPVINTKYCGAISPPPEPMISSGNQLFIRFQTDNSGESSGFRLKYESVCAATFTTQTGVITSPNYPRDYSNHTDCVYNIVLPQGKTVKLDFTAFNLEYHHNCIFDNVEVRNGLTESAPLLGRFCGTSFTQLVSTSNYMRIKFHTDATISGKGFQANYNAV